MGKFLHCLFALGGGRRMKKVRHRGAGLHFVRRRKESAKILRSDAGTDGAQVGSLFVPKPFSRRWMALGAGQFSDENLPKKSFVAAIRSKMLCAGNHGRSVKNSRKQKNRRDPGKPTAGAGNTNIRHRPNLCPNRTFLSTERTRRTQQKSQEKTTSCESRANLTS